MVGDRRVRVRVDPCCSEKLKDTCELGPAKEPAPVVIVYSEFPPSEENSCEPFKPQCSARQQFSDAAFIATHNIGLSPHNMFFLSNTGSSFFYCDGRLSAGRPLL